MVVLRIIGDEWTWEDRIALSVPPQKTFTMCIPLLVSKLGVDKWDGLALYKTEGKPPMYCRPTIPLDMVSNSQRERMRDGTVLWVRVAPSVAQQERDRVFQKSLEEWRGKNGLKCISTDGSDVKRFIEELNSHLNSTDVDDVSGKEKDARHVIEGEEHRQFSFLTSTYRERENLKQEEGDERQKLERSYMVACERLYREFWLSLRDKRIVELNALEKMGRQAVQEEQDKSFERLKQLITDSIRELAERVALKLSEAKPITDEGNQQTHEHPKGVNYDAATLLPLVRLELRALVEPMKEIYREGLRLLRQQQEAFSGDIHCFLAQLQQCVGRILRVIHSDTWRSGLLSPSQLPGPMGLEVKNALEEQQGLLTELVQEYHDFGSTSSEGLHVVGMMVLLDAVHLTQLNMCRYLKLLQERLSDVELLEGDGEGTGLPSFTEIEQDTLLKSVERNELEASQCSLGKASVRLLATTKIYLQIDSLGGDIAEIQSDVYKILLMFVSQFADLLCASLQRSEEDLKGLLRALLRELGSLQAAVDELCWTCHVVSHPMRSYFLYVTEFYAPYLCVVIDLMLHLYAGREVELLLWIRPELKSQGEFASHVTDNGSTYYYHTSAEVSQWLQPAVVADELL